MALDAWAVGYQTMRGGRAEARNCRPPTNSKKYAGNNSPTATVEAAVLENHRGPRSPTVC